MQQLPKLLPPSSPPGHTPGHMNFLIFSGQIPLPRVGNAVQMPHMEDPLDGQMPRTGAIFLGI